MTMMSLFGATNSNGTWNVAPHVRLGDAPLGTTISGRWEGDSLGKVYGHDNEVQTDAYAVFTQGTWQINDEFALTLGVRYAEDEKEAMELTGGYAEFYASALAPYLPVLNLMVGAPYVTIGAGNGAVTPSAATNVALGAASYNFDPALVAQYTAAAGAGLCASICSLFTFS